jgi:hypothetical protein
MHLRPFVLLQLLVALIEIVLHHIQEGVVRFLRDSRVANDESTESDERFSYLRI